MSQAIYRNCIDPVNPCVCCRMNGANGRAIILLAPCRRWMNPRNSELYFRGILLSFNVDTENDMDPRLRTDLYRKQLALIHILKRELKLSDRIYRALLMRTANVRSAADLDTLGFRRVINHMHQMRRNQRGPGSITDRQCAFVRALAGRLVWDAAHLRNFLVKYYGENNLGRLSRREGAKVIESLKNVLAHRTH
jgi:hypothetical protein